MEVTTLQIGLLECIGKRNITKVIAGQSKYKKIYLGIHIFLITVAL
jgi:hypothetical protein